MILTLLTFPSLYQEFLSFYSFFHFLSSSFAMSPSLYLFLLPLGSGPPIQVLLSEMDDDFGDNDDDNHHHN